MNTLTFSFANGAKQSQEISKIALENNKNIHQLFRDITSDLGAVSYTVDGEGANNVEFEYKEQHFSKQERKNAKKDYKDYKKNNSMGFVYDRKQLRNQITDILFKNKQNIKFNLKQVYLT